MSRWRRTSPDPPPPPPAPGAEVEIWSDDDGLVVTGDPTAVARVVDELRHLGDGADLTTASLPADALAVFASGFADGATSGEYLQHTARSRALLAEHGLVPTADGAFRAVTSATGVTDSRGVAGHLDWQAVGTGPERALVLQTTAIGLALRMAIKDVGDAVARIEGVVDQLVDLVRAERLGHVLGDHRTLTQLVDRRRAGGSLSSADWASVASLGPAIGRDLEALRSHVRLQLDGVDGAGTARTRADAAERLLGDAGLDETLALLLVAEQNLVLWQELRIGQIRDTEPEHLAGAIDDARSLLRTHLDDDATLVRRLDDVTGALTAPRSLDGLTPRQSSRLDDAAGDLRAVITRFADQRRIDHDAALTTDRPDLVASVRHLGARAAHTATEVARGTARGTSSAVAAARTKVRRAPDDTPPELGPGDVGAPPDPPAADRTGAEDEPDPATSSDPEPR